MGDSKMHRTFRRLHSQQLRVPLRTLRRFAAGSLRETGGSVMLHETGIRGLKNRCVG